MKLLSPTPTVSLPMRSLNGAGFKGSGRVINDVPGRRRLTFFQRLFPILFAPRRVCAWCKVGLSYGGIFSNGKVTHGMCPECSASALRELRAGRSVRAQLIKEA